MARHRNEENPDYQWFVGKVAPLKDAVDRAREEAEALVRLEKARVREARNRAIKEAHGRGLSRNAICRALGVTSGHGQAALWEEVFGQEGDWQVTPEKPEFDPEKTIEGYGWRAVWGFTGKNAVGVPFAYVTYTAPSGREFVMSRVGVDGARQGERWPDWVLQGYVQEDGGEPYERAPKWVFRLLEEVLSGPLAKFDWKIERLRALLADGSYDEIEANADREDERAPTVQPEPAVVEVTPYRDELDEMDDVPLVVEQVSPDDADW